MYWTSLFEHAVAQKNTGAVFPGLEGVSALHKPLSHLAVAEVEMSGDSVDIKSSDKQGWAGKPVAAVARTEVAVDAVIERCEGCGTISHILFSCLGWNMLLDTAQNLDHRHTSGQGVSKPFPVAKAWASAGGTVERYQREWEMCCAFECLWDGRLKYPEISRGTLLFLCNL